MNITWHGDSFFQIITQKEKNNNVNIAIDYYPKSKQSKIKADILILTSKDNFSGNEPNGCFLIHSPGEYEVKDVFVRGIPQKNNNTFYFIEAEGITLCHMGNFTEKELTPQQQESINNVDILMLPTGGGSLINSKEAHQIISQIEPKIVIPMNYKTKESSSKEKLETSDDFLKVMGIKNNNEKFPRLNIKAKDVSFSEKMKIVLLESK